MTVALATTGADPRRHRVVRVAAVRRSPDGTVSRLDLMVNPRRRLPRYLTSAARLVHDDLDEAPAFADVVPVLRELIDSHDVYAYGAAWVRAFLDAELARAGLPGLDVTMVEIDALARACLPPDRKPGLIAAAAALGIAHLRPGFPPADAEVAARVVAVLRERQAAGADRDGDADDAGLGVGPAEAADRSLPFSRAWLDSVPSGPGVYAIEDEDGTALYVGKAADLRRRLAAYVGPAPALHRRLEALAVRARRVTVAPAPSDLEATLLEARLIRERRPLFNVARRTRDARTIVRAAPHDRRPRVHLVGAVAEDGATYFGPFQSVRAAQRALNVARQVYPDAFASRAVEPGDVDRKRAAVLAVCQLLGGQKGPALDALRRAMTERAAGGDGATVDRLWKALRAVQDLQLQPSPLAGLPDDWAVLIFEDRLNRPVRVHLVKHGRLVGSADAEELARAVDATDRALTREIAAELARRSARMAAGHGSEPDDAEPTIVRRWLAQAAASIQIVAIPPDATTTESGS